MLTWIGGGQKEI